MTCPSTYTSKPLKISSVMSRSAFCISFPVASRLVKWQAESFLTFFYLSPWPGWCGCHWSSLSHHLAFKQNILLYPPFTVCITYFTPLPAPGSELVSFLGQITSAHGMEVIQPKIIVQLIKCINFFNEYKFPTYFIKLGFVNLFDCHFVKIPKKNALKIHSCSNWQTIWG